MNSRKKTRHVPRVRKVVVSVLPGAGSLLGLQASHVEITLDGRLRSAFVGKRCELVEQLIRESGAERLEARLLYKGDEPEVGIIEDLVDAVAEKFDRTARFPTQISRSRHPVYGGKRQTYWLRLLLFPEAGEALDDSLWVDDGGDLTSVGESTQTSDMGRMDAPEKEGPNQPKLTEVKDTVSLPPRPSLQDDISRVAAELRSIVGSHRERLNSMPITDSLEEIDRGIEAIKVEFEPLIDDQVRRWSASPGADLPRGSGEHEKRIARGENHAPVKSLNHVCRNHGFEFVCIEDSVPEHYGKAVSLEFIDNDKYKAGGYKLRIYEPHEQNVYERAGKPHLKIRSTT